MCECEECKRSARVDKIRDFLKMHDQKELLDHLEELYETYAHDSMDHDVLKAIVENKWPSAEFQMKKWGWRRG